MSNVVEVEDLTKMYGGVSAIDKVSFTLEEGKVYGLLGRNGAGKTTLTRLLTAQIFATSGNLRVFGERPYENKRVLSQICFIREEQKYPRNFRVGDILDVAARFFPRWDCAYAAVLLEAFQLSRKKRVQDLSRGMLTVVGIVVGLASRAPLTIFDEPYMGLDVVARSLFYDRLIEDYAEHPRTIVLSTHLIDEVSRLLEHVIVIDKGNILLNEDADVLRSRAFTVIGSAPEVAAFTAGKEVIGDEQFGSLVSATVFGSVDMDRRRQALASGLEFSPVSLQQLVVHLTKDGATRKALESL